MDQVKVGTYTGDGAAQNISLGWTPDFVMVVNVTDGDIISTWFSGMTDGTSVDIAAAVAANADNAISDYAGAAAGATPGFSVGTDLSENGKVYRYMALRNH